MLDRKIIFKIFALVGRLLFSFLSTIFTEMETAPLPWKGCKFRPTCMIGADPGHCAESSLVTALTVIHVQRIYMKVFKVTCEDACHPPFGSGIVTTRFNNLLGLSFLGIEHPTFLPAWSAKIYHCGCRIVMYKSILIQFHKIHDII